MFLLYAGASATVRAQPNAATPTETDAAHAQPAEPFPTATREATLTSLLTHHRDGFGRACDRRQVVARDELRFIACGIAGVWVVRVTAQEALWVSSQDVGGSAEAFFVRHDRLWVEVGGVHAVDLGVPQAAAMTSTSENPRVVPSSPAVPTTAAAAAPVRVEARPVSRIPVERVYGEQIRVVSILDDGVMVSLDENRGLVPGLRVAFYPPSGAGESAAATTLRAPEPLAIGELVAISDRRGRVALGTNERVPVGAWGRPTAAPASRSSFAPPRVAGVWEFAFVARPFLVLDNVGAGLFIDGRVGYRFAAPLHIEALIAPFAVASARDGAATPFGGLISAAFDTRLFEVGLGLGVQTVNDPDFGLDRGTGTLVAQRLRIGALDGAHLEAISYVALFHSTFTFSSVRVEARIPVGSRAWLHLAGGGGSLGLGYGELGLRVLTSGNGGPGSFFLTALVGGIQVFEDCNAIDSAGCKDLNYFGPMVGAGGEWRL
jgi:hypothetical protein